MMIDSRCAIRGELLSKDAIMIQIQGHLAQMRSDGTAEGGETAFLHLLVGGVDEPEYWMLFEVEESLHEDHKPTSAPHHAVPVYPHTPQRGEFTTGNL
jgi:hypothetical protein